MKRFVIWTIAAAFLQVPLFAAGLVKQNVDTTDAMATLGNYDRGFYTPQVLHLKPSGGKPIEKPSGRLLHLRAEISEFSSHAWLGIDTTGGKNDTTWGKNQDLTEDALNVLQESLDSIRAIRGFAVVRICYDPWYNGRSNVTPDHEWVLKHVKQLDTTFPTLSRRDAGEEFMFPQQRTAEVGACIIDPKKNEDRERNQISVLDVITR